MPWLQDGGVASVTDLVDIGEQCTSGLLCLYQRGVIHRDLRRDNVLVSSRDRLCVKIADFGLSHQLPAYASGAEQRTAILGHATILQVDAPVGHEYWLAPEACCSTDQGLVASPATDVYMLGFCSSW